MSMKGKLGMLMAMSMMLGGASGMPSMPSPQPRPKPRKLSPEEEVVELEKAKEKFLIDLQKHNEERNKNFPKWKEFEVHGLFIIASNQKNAYRDLTILMRQNSISIKEN